MNKWILGARPRTLTAAIAPVVVATALAGSEWNWFRAALALKVSLWLQIGVNFANDYSDGVKGTDRNRVGPTRLTASGLASPQSVKKAALLSFLIAALSGLWLALLSSPWLLLVGMLAILAAWGYTGGKKPYGYLGFGEISVFIFFGVVATVGTFFAQTGRITFQSFAASIPLGALSCAILAINNLRDRELDLLSGKRTLAVRLGDSGARALYNILITLAHLSVFAIGKMGAFLTLLVLPLSWTLIRNVSKGATGEKLIPLLGKTGQLQLLFALLLAVGIFL